MNRNKKKMYWMKNSLLQIIVYIKNICEPKDFYTFEFCINIQMIPEIKKKRNPNQISK